MRRQALASDDRLALPRSEYLLGRVDLYRGRGVSAVHHLRRCITSLSLFDRFASRHLWGALARAAAEMGDTASADEALAAGSAAAVVKTYEPEWQLARAAVLASRMALEEAADLAAGAAGIAAGQCQWGGALLAYHDAARYGAARAVLPAMRRLPAVDGPLATCLVGHVEALAANDPHALDEVAVGLEELGALAWAREATAEAARAHARAGAARAARASANRAARPGERLETPLPPWLVDLGEGGQPLTARERQIALLAARGHSDKSIAERLGVSPRTASTHLSHCYDKLGVTGRVELADMLDTSKHQ
jgi:DNA-binding CsgD family transcriptional regulator